MNKNSDWAGSKRRRSRARQTKQEPKTVGHKTVMTLDSYMTALREQQHLFERSLVKAMTQ